MKLLDKENREPLYILLGGIAAIIIDVLLSIVSDSWFHHCACQLSIAGGLCIGGSIAVVYN